MKFIVVLQPKGWIAIVYTSLYHTIWCNKDAT